MTIKTCQYPTPVGPMTVLAIETDGDFVVIAAGFCPSVDLWERLPAAGRCDQSAAEATDRLGSTHDAIEAYLSGDLTALATVPVRQAGTELQQQVWKGLRQIPAGRTKSYSELAKTTTNPKAVRAVGTACGRNLIAPMVPCHRALRSDGSMGGYYYGLEVKRWLLEHEGYSATKPSTPATDPNQLTLPT